LPQPAVTVERFYLNHAEKLQLTLVAGGTGLSRKLEEGSVHRPGLGLAGFFQYFANKRVQVIGGAEWRYLKHLGAEEAERRVAALIEQKVPCLVFTRNLNPPAYVRRLCDEAKVPLFRSHIVTLKFLNAATIALELEFAPQTSEIGSMVDIMGIGVLIRGESGIGKSETVLGLLERGYSLVSDDVTRFRLFENREVIGTSPETTRYHMEVRGIGIINVPAVFGVVSVRPEKRLDMVVTLQEWDKAVEVDRIGMDRHLYDVLGISVPHITIPIRPGRDIARIIEVAALDQKLKTLGHNAAREFNERLIEKMRTTTPTQ
jgi:HPr kinase/phosphorylase